MIEFCECANYRGPLQDKEEGGKFFWRVACDFEETEWNEITASLWAALQQYHEGTAEQPRLWLYFSNTHDSKKNSKDF